MSNTAFPKSESTKSEKRTKVIYYRQAVFRRILDFPTNEPQPKDTLEDLLIKALETLNENNNSASRPLEDNYTEILETTDGKLSKAPSNFMGHTGIIYKTREGDKVAASKGGKNSATIVLAQPIDDENQPVAPASGIIYFAIYKNHLTYLADSNNADNRIKDFLSWMISTKTKTLDPLYRLELISTFTNDVRKRIEKHGVKKISFNSRTEVNVINGWGDQLRKLIFGIGDEETHIVRTTEEEKAALNGCEFTLYIKTGKKNKGLKQEALASYCALLTDEQLSQLSFELGDGSKIAQGEVTKTRKEQIEYREGVASSYSARRVLSSWLTQIAENDTIS